MSSSMVKELGRHSLITLINTTYGNSSQLQEIVFLLVLGIQALPCSYWVTVPPLSHTSSPQLQKFYI
jgi:hypothetical protein